ncbi:MAG: hypothetical protein CL952_08085 [Erythrobacteraceae bacterium]|nr:hypothetical protein [Erythrobacteraceae bacterium]
MGGLGICNQGCEARAEIRADIHFYLGNVELRARYGVERTFRTFHIAHGQRRIAVRGGGTACHQKCGERKDKMLAVDHHTLHITRVAARQRGCKFPRTGR